jgi:hypothetical protein
MIFPDGVMHGRGVWWVERGRIGGAGGGRDNDLRDVAGGCRIWPAGGWTASSTGKKRDWPVVWKGYDKGKKITDLTNVLERINI